MANTALSQGKSEKDAIVAGLAAVKNMVHKAVAIPLHLQAVLDLVEKARSEPTVDTAVTSLEAPTASSSWFSSTIHQASTVVDSRVF